MNDKRINGSRARKSTPTVKESKRIAAYLDQYLDVTKIPVLEDKDDRINYCASLMFECKWIKGITANVLAKAWGVQANTIETYSAEASRIVRNAQNPEEVRLSALNVLTTGALQLFREAQANGDQKGAAAIGKLLAEVTGANAPTKIHATVEGNVTPLSAKQVMDGLFNGGVGQAKGEGSELLEADSEGPEAFPVQEPETVSETESDD